MPEFDSAYRVIRRLGEPDIRSLDAYRQQGGYSALEKAVREQTPEQIILQVLDAKLRGRGGAGRLTGEKWRIVRRQDDNSRYVVCNAYDADPRSWAARTMLERNPHQVIEGIVLAALAVGASEAYLFTRSLYLEGIASVQRALQQALDANLVGREILGTDFSCTINILGVDLGFMGGEETVQFAVIKGRRGMPEQRPPYPAQLGLWDRPTAVNCIENYVPDSEPRVVEIPFGATLREILRHAGYSRTDGELRAVVVGGAEGGALPTSLLDTPFDYDPLEEAGAIVGSGIVELLPANTCMVAWAMERSRYLSKESCGKCVPCRIGMKRVTGILEGIVSDLAVTSDLDMLDEFSRYIPDGSLCGFGIQATNALKTAKRYWPDHFRAHVEDQECPTGSCVPLRAHRFVTKHVLP